MELIDRLCAVNTLLTEIVKEQAEIIAQSDIDVNSQKNFLNKTEKAEQENDLIEAALRRYITEED